MSKFLSLCDDLNLIYFEYDKDENKFEVDKNATKNQVHNEFIKLTYNLTKAGVEFLVDEKGDIVISCKDTILSRLKCRLKNIFSNFNSENKNIFVLSDKKVKYAKNLPVIDIKAIEKEIDINGYDGLIFTSKNGVEAINKLEQDWKNKPSYVIAPQTAKAVKKYGGKLAYVGKLKHGNEFAHELLNKFQDQKLLYIGGKKVVSNLVEILNENGLSCDKVDVYETVCKEYKNNLQLPKNSIFIFSSPSTIECFLKNFKWDESFKAVSIGNTTAKYFPPYIKPYISQTTSLDSCVKTALTI